VRNVYPHIVSLGLIANYSGVTLQFQGFDAQSPVQPEKNEFAPFVVRACRVTEAPVSNAAVQLAPQLMPAGELVTVPTPVLVTVSGNLIAFTR
jgi:hypothetical protein